MMLDSGNQSVTRQIIPGKTVTKFRFQVSDRSFASSNAFSALSNSDIGCLLTPLLTPASLPVSLVNLVPLITGYFTKELVKFDGHLCLLELVEVSTVDVWRDYKLELMTRKQKRQAARLVSGLTPPTHLVVVGFS